MISLCLEHDNQLLVIKVRIFPSFFLRFESITIIGNFNDLCSFCWQAEEAKDHCKACQVDVGVKRVELVNTKNEIITQIREMVSQCDLTLKAVS